jgi:hypothetical protein
MGFAGIAGVLLVLAVTVSGCSDDTKPAAEPTSTASTRAPAAPTPAKLDPPARSVRTADLEGPGGMTIRYLDSDGKIKIIRVEDLPR